MSFGDYWSAMDRVYGAIDESGLKKSTEQMEAVGLGAESIGTSTHPFQHQVTSFAAKIRSGAGRIELSFIGQGKGNAQQPNPESFGARDRADLRALAEMNKIKTSVHASIHQQSLAGFGQEGFSENARHAAVKEIERAIQFAAEATKGGAIVFHTHEWQRPLIDAGKYKNGDSMFKMTDEEAKRAPKFIVDSRTGEMNAVRSDHRMYEPDFFTAEQYEKEMKKKYGEDYKIIGAIRKVDFKYIDPETKKLERDSEMVTVEKNDWVDIDGNPIKKEWILDHKKAIKLFDRVPLFDKDRNEFEVKIKTFNDFETDAKALRLRAEELEKKGIKGVKDITAEELFFKTQLANQVLQAKGQSLYHGQSYERFEKERRLLQKKETELKESIKFFEDKNIDMNQKAEKLISLQLADPDSQYSFSKTLKMIEDGNAKELIEKNLEKIRDGIQDATNHMRHTHESSAHADAQAQQALDRMNHVESVEKFGLQKTAQTIAEAAMLAFDYTKKAGKQLDEKLYVAAENYRPEMYGSHPDEIRKIIKESRNKFAEMLVTKKIIKDEEKAKKEAEEYIKATIDSGHFNMWRQFFKAESKDGKEASIDEKNKQFDKWMLKEMNKLAEEGLIGHVHLTDNFGYDDEHLSPGQGNTPIRDFVQTMKKNKVKDIIAEAGSFNGETVLHESWAHLGSPVYGAHGSTQFTQIRHQHFGYQNQPGYIVGAYSPSNEWKLWSEVDLH